MGLEWKWNAIGAELEWNWKDMGLAKDAEDGLEWN